MHDGTVLGPAEHRVYLDGVTEMVQRSESTWLNNV